MRDILKAGRPKSLFDGDSQSQYRRLFAVDLARMNNVGDVDRWKRCQRIDAQKPCSLILAEQGDELAAGPQITFAFYAV